MALKITGEADTELFTAAKNHGFRVGQKVALRRLTGGTGITGQARGSLTPPAVRYVIATGLTAKDFKVSTTPGGSAYAYSTDVTAGEVRRLNGMGG